MKRIRNDVRSILRTCSRFYCSKYENYSLLIALSDSPSWSIGHDMRELRRLAKILGIRTGPAWLAHHGDKQSVFVGNHFDLLLSDRWFHTSHRLATAYFHGKPGQGVAEFDSCFEALIKKHQQIDRLQVSCKSMREMVLETGIDPQKIHLIPIGVNNTLFSPQKSESRLAARLRFGIPNDAFVLGSFQKDGNGWGEGIEPKMIKGPDVFLNVIKSLSTRIKNLFVLLSGPARGYVKRGLKDINIPYVHHLMKNYSELETMYHALNAYVVSSREEGGPKSVLESMASGIPLVSTRVGQAVDLVKHGENGWLVDIEDVEGLAYWIYHIFEQGEAINPIVQDGLETARQNCYEAQLPLWKQLFKGFVE